MAEENLSTYSFPVAGPRNTEKTLRAAIERALQHPIMKKITLDGYPTSPADYAQGQRNSPKDPGTPGASLLKYSTSS